MSVHSFGKKDLDNEARKLFRQATESCRKGSQYYGWRIEIADDGARLHVLYAAEGVPHTITLDMNARSGARSA